MERPNSTYIDQLANGDLEFKSKLVNVVKKELVEENDEYQHALQNEEWDEAAGRVHKLKHKLGLFGLEKAYNIAAEYEIQLKENKTGLKNEFEAAVQQMQSYVDSLN